MLFTRTAATNSSTHPLHNQYLNPFILRPLASRRPGFFIDSKLAISPFCFRTLGTLKPFGSFGCLNFIDLLETPMGTSSLREGCNVGSSVPFPSSTSSVGNSSTVGDSCICADAAANSATRLRSSANRVNWSLTWSKSLLHACRIGT